MFGIGKKQPKSFEVDSHETGQRVIVVASSEKDAYKNLPEDVREEIKRGRVQMRRIA